MNERDRNKDRLEAIPERRRPPDVPAPPGKRDPCAEIAAKLEAKRKQLEEKQAEIEKLTAESFRAVGVDDVLTPKNFKQLQEEYSILSVVELHRFLEEYSDYLPVEDFKSWVKAGMPESSDEEKHKKVSHLLREYDEIRKKKALESWGLLDPEDSDAL